MSSPLPATVTLPFSTTKLSRLPLLICGLPVVKVARSELIMPQPSQCKPLGLAIITSAFLPATST
ncbi:hypothetical protein COI_0222 [Mannheimia haemolytica serotype A2 str. OVINE]|nr:hypothetical protein COI_0222 [Mannheimia haemolytica serotype A2 str. OVINE]